MSRAALLDTHALLWYSVSPDKLSDDSRGFIRNSRNTVFVSAVTAWELGIKSQLGKLPEAESLLEHYHRRLEQYSFTDLPFTSAHALAAAGLAHPHKDPFDRALVAQAASEGLSIISRDDLIRGFPGVRVIW